MLTRLGFGEAWQQQSVGNVDAFVSLFKQRVMDIDAQDWHGLVQDYGNLRTYRTLKSELSLEWYLTIGFSKKVINWLARLRGGLLHIKMNEGRWANVARENRICPACNTGEIEDEVHFIFHCRAWSTLRLGLKSFYVFRFEDLSLLFTTKNKPLLLRLYKFIRNAIHERESVVRL